MNPDPYTANHYGKNISLLGDAAQTLKRLCMALKNKGASPNPRQSEWLNVCVEQRKRWEAFKKERYDHPIIWDEAWNQEVLTQPAAIKIATDWARQNEAVSFFDAGDVQANGFQVVEDEQVGLTITDTGLFFRNRSNIRSIATMFASLRFELTSSTTTACRWLAKSKKTIRRDPTY